MRRILWLPLVLAACAGPDSDPLDVATRFHALRSDGDDRGIHALLTEADRAAVPLEAFPAAIPAGLALNLFGWEQSRLDSASVLNVTGDTATVVLHSAGARDTVRLVATHAPLSLWGFQMDRVRWRVSLGLAERAQLDSLAAGLQADDTAPDSAMVEQATAYLRAAEAHPELARPADLDAARSALRRAAVARALEIELRTGETITGAGLLEGRVENSTDRPVSTLRLVVWDDAGNEERVDLWDVPPGASMPIRQLSSLRTGPVTYRLERIQVY